MTYGEIGGTFGNEALSVIKWEISSEASNIEERSTTNCTRKCEEIKNT